MLYNTHLFFSNITYDNIRCGYCVKIKKLGFKYGNIKPDLMMNFKNTPHNYYSSADYIISEIYSLIEETPRLKDLQSNDFAVKLGIIDHYIADFFCMPHNKNLVKKNIVAHFIYEQKINAICKKIRIRKLRKHLTSNGIGLNIDDNISEILSSMYENYKRETFSAFNDILFAIQTSIIVNNYVVKSCISKIKSNAA